MRRVPFTLAAVVSAAALCVAVCVLWVRSYGHGGMLERTQDKSPAGRSTRQTLALVSCGGRLAIYVGKYSTVYGPRDFRLDELWFPDPPYFHADPYPDRWRAYPTDRRPDANDGVEPTSGSEFRWARAGFGVFACGKTSVRPVNNPEILRIQDVDHGRIGVIVPHWCIALVMALLPARWVLREVHSRRRAGRTRRRLCPACGYDLRATPDRCPECGTMPAAGKEAA